MILKKALSNILSKIKSYSKKRLLIIGIGVILLVVICISIGKNAKSKNQYKKAIQSHNEEVKRYNLIVDERMSFISGLSSRKIAYTNNEQFEKKQSLKESYSSSKKDSIKSISDASTQIKTESELLQKGLNEDEKAVYTSLIEKYNKTRSSYNALIDRMSSTNDGAILEKKKEKEDVASDGTAWKSVDKFFESLDILIKDTDALDNDYYTLCLKAHNDILTDYNIVAEAYNDLLTNCSVKFIKDMPLKAELKNKLSDDEVKNLSESELLSFMDKTLDETKQLSENYLIAKQLVNPDATFVKTRLKEISNITGMSSVSLENDPNGLLGKNGGYTSCVYFTVKEINANDVKGDSIIAKGTDAGGAIEVYKTLEDALNRCDYLSQFDGTLLYSGSYTIVGTIVIRTSYKLTDEQQVELTNNIIQAFTVLK